MSTPTNFNPNLTTPHSDSPIANQWWSGLSFNQQEFIRNNYNLPSMTPYSILIAYQNRNGLRSAPNWPETSFTQI